MTRLKIGRTKHPIVSSLINSDDMLHKTHISHDYVHRPIKTTRYISPPFFGYSTQERTNLTCDLFTMLYATALDQYFLFG